MSNGFPVLLVVRDERFSATKSDCSNYEQTSFLRNEGAMSYSVFVCLCLLVFGFCCETVRLAQGCSLVRLGSIIRTSREGV